VEAEVLRQPSGPGWLVDPDGTVTKAADDIAMAANFVDQGALLLTP
jgi:hypothetical protein